MKQIIFIKKTGILNLVFEFMETDLLELMKSREPKKLSEEEIRDIMYQTLLGLSFMHKYGFFHRDMKPENLLLVGKKIKIADFGLAREIRSLPPYTEYVSTRYYRAPECILQFTNYNSPIDIWGLGCIMAEMYLHPQPLFFGANEKEVLFRICSILGSPNYDVWSDGIQQSNLIGIKFPNNDAVNLSKVIPNASNEAIDLIKQMLQWDPNKRPTAAKLLNHPFFSNHTIYEHFFTTKNVAYHEFDETSFKKFSNKNKENKNNNDNKNNNENKKNDNKMMTDNDIEKLINQMKKEKIEEDKKYENEFDLGDYNDNEDEFDLGNMINDNIGFIKNNNSNSTNENKEKNENKEINDKKEEPLPIKNIMSEDTSQKKNNNNEDSDDEFDLGIHSNIQLKSNTQVFNNRRRSARQFLEETENNFQEKKKSEIGDKSNINDLLFQFKNNEFNNFSENKPVIMKNEFVSRRGENNNLNRLFDKGQNKNMIIGDNEFPRKNEEKFNFNPGYSENSNDKKDSFFWNNSRRSHNWQI